MSTTSDIVIIGAGFAGAATAYFLARRQAGKILLIEQEETAGVHASGQNAAMIRQQIEDPEIAGFAAEGAKWLREERYSLPGSVGFNPCGSLLLGRSSSLRKMTATCESNGIPIQSAKGDPWRRQFPVLERAPFEAGSFCPTDGVVDIHAYLQGWLTGFRQMGGTIWMGSPVKEVTTTEEKIIALKTERGEIHPGCVVNAAGAWAGVLGRMAGAEELGLNPCRRHLFFAEPISVVHPGDPFIWNVDHTFYFRPETGGILLSACDEEPFPAGPCPTDVGVKIQLLEKLRHYMPRLAGVRVTQSWAGLRTLTPDGRFIVRWDQRIKNLFWVAGLGGHGVTSAPSVGRLAAERIVATPVFT